MKKLILILTFVSLASLTYSQIDYQITDSILYQRALGLSKSFTLVDTHIDLPDWLYDEWFDVTAESNKGEIDFPRAVKGGLDVAFMSIYTSPSLEGTGKSKAKSRLYDEPCA